MKKVVKLTESDLTRIIKRVVNENREHRRDLDLQSKLDDIFFGHDSSNLTSGQGDFGYLSQEHRLSKKISPKQRVERAEQVISELKRYIKRLEDMIEGESSYTSSPEYDDVWRDIESD